MDRRTSIGLLLGKTRTKQKKQKEASTSLVSFNPYSGPWEWEHAAHLLRRTTFGPTKTQISQAVADGLAGTISTLFESQALPDPPIYYNFDNDPNVPNGETWINEKDPLNINGLTNARRQSFFAWSIKQMRDSGTNIREKMVLFWHNHFVVANINLGRQMYGYINFLRENALGNFRTLVDGITIDSAMLLYLNGTQNSVFGPNENYARELLELFTVGKGPTVSPGDYTNYKEEDIAQIARALTGWRHFNANNNNDPADSNFVSNRHDTGEKQLSDRFDNQVIMNAGENEYKTVIDLIFQKDEVARFICRKLYRWFVHADLTGDVETDIIEPMAQMMIADDYEIKNALMALLSSEHFYSVELRGCMVAHPIDHFFKLINTFEMPMPTGLLQEYAVSRPFHNRLQTAEMAMFDHPTVAGWKAFYQAPQFDKLWINSVSLPLRQSYANDFMDGYNNNGFHLEINVLDFTANLSNPINPDDLIIETASILFAQTLTDEQVVALKDILIPGLPDFEWSVEYGDYIGGNTSLEDAVNNKLKALIGTMVNMPEFHLI